MVFLTPPSYVLIEIYPFDFRAVLVSLCPAHTATSPSHAAQKQQWLLSEVIDSVWREMEELRYVVVLMFVHSWKLLLQIIIYCQVRLFYVFICCFVVYLMYY